MCVGRTLHLLIQLGNAIVQRIGGINGLVQELVSSHHIGSGVQDLSCCPGGGVQDLSCAKTCTR